MRVLGKNPLDQTVFVEMWNEHYDILCDVLHEVYPDGRIGHEMDWAKAFRKLWELVKKLPQQRYPVYTRIHCDKCRQMFGVCYPVRITAEAYQRLDAAQWQQIFAKRTDGDYVADLCVGCKDALVHTLWRRCDHA